MHHLPQCQVQAGQLYLRELRGLEASARVTGDQSIAIISHLVAFGPNIISPAGSRCVWILEPQSSFGTIVKVAFMVELHQRYDIFHEYWFHKEK